MRCGEIETYRHLLWDCRETKKIWQSFNEWMTYLEKRDERVLTYDGVFEIGNLDILTKIKIRVIQAMIQVERPINWSIENVKKIVNELKGIEIYNSKIGKKIEVTRRKWDNIGH